MAVNESLTPFKYAEDIEKHIPKAYIQNKDGLVHYNWFLNAPKYSTFRINLKKYNGQGIIDVINQQLLKESKIRNIEPPKVFIHNIINDCIVVPNWQHEYKQQTCEYNVIVDVACANAVLRGADIFAPGILSMSSQAKIGDNVNIFADVERKCTRGFNEVFTGKTILVGNGIVKITRKDLFKHNATVRGIGVEVHWNSAGVPRLKFSEDAGLLQNFPSIVCGHLFHSITGNILDLCGAPGNKTTHIATLLGDKGEVVALDKTPEKVSKIANLCKKFGLSNVRYYVCDSTKCICEDGANPAPTGPPFKGESFSAVLLDPPCSALGQRPALMNEISPSQLKSYVSLQRQLFESAIKAVRKGGLLVYSTCTITIEENEEMVSWALKHFPEIGLKKVEPSFGRPGLQESSLDDNERKLVSRFGFPDSETVEEDTIGFFIACFYKKV